jgi:hypothetical protein
MGAHHDARNLLANALLKSELLRWKLDKEDVVLSNLEIKNTLTHVSDALKLVSSVFKESLRPESPGETFAARPR